MINKKSEKNIHNITFECSCSKNDVKELYKTLQSLETDIKDLYVSRNHTHAEMKFIKDRLKNIEENSSIFCHLRSWLQKKGFLKGFEQD